MRAVYHFIKKTKKIQRAGQRRSLPDIAHTHTLYSESPQNRNRLPTYSQGQPSRTMEEDILAWAHERSGCYSVHSAYRLLKKEETRRAQEKASRGGTSGGDQWWKALKKIEVPPKVRIFWWRVINNFLPSKAELKRRHVIKESHCEVCGYAAEDLFHIIVECPWARRFWEAIFNTTGRKFPALHPVTWAMDLLAGRVCSKEDSALFMCGGWSLWTNRNARDHGRSQWSPQAAAKHVGRMVEEVVCLHTKGVRNNLRVTASWKRPAEGWVKLNTDGAFDVKYWLGSVAAVVRDHHGQVRSSRRVHAGLDVLGML
jgi:hypothetical protein